MDRYQNINQLKTSTGKRYYSSTRYPYIPLSSSDLYIITLDGDRLDNLANQFYGDPTLYWILQVANPKLSKDSLYPDLGFQLRIPTNLVQILDDFEVINS